MIPRRIAGRALGISLLLDDAVRYLWLNVLWALTCATVIGVPAATAAMHRVVAENAQGDQSPILPRYARALRAQALPASAVGAALAGLWALLMLNVVITSLMGRVSGTILLGLLGAVVLPLVLVTATAPAVLAEGSPGITATIRTSLRRIAESPVEAVVRALSLAVLMLAVLAFPPLLLILPAPAVRGIVALRRLLPGPDTIPPRELLRSQPEPLRKDGPMTTLSIDGNLFLLDGKVVNAGRRLGDIPLDGLLLNSRMINGIFDDLNPATRHQWVYPDTGEWDAERNTREFVAAMPQWREDGLDAFTIGVQGGSPFGYSKDQPWDSGGYHADGSLRPEFFDRLRRILDEADRLGFAVIVDLFYQGQEMRLADDDAVRRAVADSAAWLLEGGWRNVAVEIANECNIPHEYQHSRLMRGENVHELIALAQSAERDGRRLLVSSSFVDTSRWADDPSVVFVPDAVLEIADFVLIHGNGTPTPSTVPGMADWIRGREAYRGVPIIVNEDDHFDFDAEVNYMKAALAAGVSWGYFDPGSITTWPVPQPTAGDYENGFQSVPVNWGPSSEMKRQFFATLRSAR